MAAAPISNLAAQLSRYLVKTNVARSTPRKFNLNPYSQRLTLSPAVASLDMPIIYVHGVNTRNPDHFVPIKAYLQRIVAPAIAKDPENVAITAADWFSLCEPPKWEGIARPRSVLLGQGAENVASPEQAVMLDAIIQKTPLGSAPASNVFTTGQTETPASWIKVESLSAGALVHQTIQIRACMSMAIVAPTATARAKSVEMEPEFYLEACPNKLRKHQHSPRLLPAI